MDHDETFTLMMEALDGELAAESKQQLEAHLRACPGCLRQWRGLVAVETLFRNAPLLAPAVGFTQRTLARLPDRRLRRWAVSAIYVLFLAGGAVPILLGAWALNRYQPILSQPELLESILQTLQRTLQVFTAVLSAVISGAGQYLVREPVLMGWLLVTGGVVLLWGGVFRQMISHTSRTSRA